jgi:hypothetical protein
MRIDGPTAGEEHVLVAFARGGTRTEVDASSPALCSPALGTWQHTGGTTYSSVSEVVIFNAAGVFRFILYPNAWVKVETLFSDGPRAYG